MTLVRCFMVKAAPVQFRLLLSLLYHRPLLLPSFVCFPLPISGPSASICLHLFCFASWASFRYPYLSVVVHRFWQFRRFCLATFLAFHLRAATPRLLPFLPCFNISFCSAPSGFLLCPVCLPPRLLFASFLPFPFNPQIQKSNHSDT